jgi:hypothetical protein
MSYILNLIDKNNGTYLLKGSVCFVKPTSSEIFNDLKEMIDIIGSMHISGLEIRQNVSNMRHAGFTFSAFFGDRGEAEKQHQRIEQCIKTLI